MKFGSTNEAVESFFSARMNKRKNTQSQPNTQLQAESSVSSDDNGNSGDSKKEVLNIIQSFLMAIMNNKSLIIISCVFMFIFMCAYGYSINSERANAKLSLNYEEASSGLYPNGTHFNIYDICSDTVLNKAIEYAGLTTDDIDTDELKNSISISAPTSKSADYYIATSYNIQFVKPKQLKNIKSEDMLSLICRAYKDYFFNNFAGNSNVLKTDFKFSDSLEYDEICQELCNTASKTQNYLSMRIKEGKTFTATDGSTFRSMDKEVQSIIDYDLTDLNAYIWEHGVLKDSKTYINTLEYKNYTLNKSYKTYMIEYNDRLAGIDKYNQAMSASVLIPTYNSVYEFYMSRTKNGVDYLADDSDKQLTLAEEVDRTLKINKDKISKANGVASTAASSKKTESMISTIETKMSKLSARIQKADTEYRIQKTKNYLTLGTFSLSTLQVFGVKNAFLITILFFIVIVYIFHLPYAQRKQHLFKRRKKQ